MAIRAKNEKVVDEPVTKTYFPSMEVENDETVDLVPADYTPVNLEDLGDGTEYSGRPVVSPIESYTFDDDGNEKTGYRMTLYIVDDEEKEYLQKNINLKKPDTIQVNIRKGSVLYDFLGSIKELEVPGYMTNYNIIKKANIKEFAEFINELSEATITVVEHEFARNNSVYYGFNFIDAQM